MTSDLYMSIQKQAHPCIHIPHKHILESFFLSVFLVPTNRVLLANIQFLWRS